MFCWATFSNAIALREIASLAKQLDIPYRVATTARERNDMIEAEFLVSPALYTPPSIALPDLALDCPRDSLSAGKLPFHRGHPQRINGCGRLTLGKLRLHVG